MLPVAAATFASAGTVKSEPAPPISIVAVALTALLAGVVVLWLLQVRVAVAAAALVLEFTGSPLPLIVTTALGEELEAVVDSLVYSLFNPFV